MAQAGIPAWSQTPATNASVDANINWAEGQLPSSVNDSARAMMAAHAKWRDDNSGALTTAGSSTAYTVSTNQVFDGLTDMNGQTLRLKFDEANGAAPTLNVDGLGAKAIHTAAGTAVASGFIRANAIHDVVFDNANSCWVLANTGGIGVLDAPTGTKLIFPQAAAPTGWTKDTTHDNKALRLVTGGTGGTAGGVNPFTSVFATRTILQANLPSVNFTVTIPAGQGSHSHTFNGATAAVAGASFGRLRHCDGI
jgi:hypothetical protein